VSLIANQIQVLLTAQKVYPFNVRAEKLSVVKKISF